MVQGIVTKLEKGMGATTRQIHGKVKREDTGEEIPFKASAHNVPGIAVGDWVSGTVAVNSKMMQRIKFAGERVRSGVKGRYKKQ
jgi:hypothetical protein